MVPAIVNAQDKSLVELAVACKDLIERAQGGHLRQEEYNGTFSTSNLGMFGVDDFSAIILPPQAAVLAIGAVKKQPVVVNDQIVVRQALLREPAVEYHTELGELVLDLIEDRLERLLTDLIEAIAEQLLRILDQAAYLRFFILAF